MIDVTHASQLMGKLNRPACKETRLIECEALRRSGLGAVVLPFGLRWRNIAHPPEYAPRIQSNDPFQRHVLDVLAAAPQPTPMDHLHLVGSNDRLRKGVTVSFACAADRQGRTGIRGRCADSVVAISVRRKVGSSTRREDALHIAHAAPDSVQAIKDPVLAPGSTRAGRDGGR